MNKLFFFLRQFFKAVGGILDSAETDRTRRFACPCDFKRILCLSAFALDSARHYHPHSEEPPSRPPPFPSPWEDYSRSCCPEQSAAISANGPPYTVFTSGFRCSEDIKYFVPQSKALENKERQNSQSVAKVFE